MKKTLLIPLILFFVFTNNLIGQSTFKLDERANKFIGNAKVECVYSYTVNTTLKKDTTEKRTLKYYTILQTNGSDSKFWDWHSFKKDSIIFSTKDRTEYDKRKLESKYFFGVSELFTPVIFKNYKDSKFMLTDEMTFMALSYTEKKSNQKIELKEDTLTIGGYLCQKAIIHYADNTWAVWYAPDIPISDGPWKLCGLPGLILKAEDKNNIHCFEIMSFRNSNRPIYIKINPKLLEVKKKEYLKEKNIFENLDIDDIIVMEGLPSSGAISLEGDRLALRRDVKYIPMEFE